MKQQGLVIPSYITLVTEQDVNMLSHLCETFFANKRFFTEHITIKRCRISYGKLLLALRMGAPKHSSIEGRGKLAWVDYGAMRFTINRASNRIEFKPRFHLPNLTPQKLFHHVVRNNDILVLEIPTSESDCKFDYVVRVINAFLTNYKFVKKVSLIGPCETVSAFAKNLNRIFFENGYGFNQNGVGIKFSFYATENENPSSIKPAGANYEWHYTRLTAEEVLQQLNTAVPTLKILSV